MGIIFGPINSRRFGKSLGVDLSPQQKQCNFDCLYCELPPAKKVESYNSIVEVEKILDSLKDALEKYRDIDVITLTANGEPTLYPHLNRLIEEINQIKKNKKLLILSNASTIDKKSIQNALLKLDIVKLSLDCATNRCLKRLDRPIEKIDIENIKSGMLKFKEQFTKELIVETLFVKGINDREKEIKELDEFLKELKPTRVDIGTIDRPPAYRVEALTYANLREISLKFSPQLPINIVSRKRVDITPSFYSKEQILQTLKKRPLTIEDIEILFDKNSQKNFKELLESGAVEKIKNSNQTFFTTKI